jgi:hypothetical protein
VCFQGLFSIPGPFFFWRCHRTHIFLKISRIFLLAHYAYPVSRSYLDPAQEIARIRHSLSLIESHLFPYQRNPSTSNLRNSNEAQSFPKREMADLEVVEKDSAPGMLGRQGHGGLYAGPTSAATHLVTVISTPSLISQAL